MIFKKAWFGERFNKNNLNNNQFLRDIGMGYICSYNYSNLNPEWNGSLYIGSLGKEDDVLQTLDTCLEDLMKEIKLS